MRLLALSVVFAAIPRFVERHAVPGLELDPPTIVFLLGRSRDQAEHDTEPLDLEWPHRDTAVSDRNKRRKKPGDELPRPLRIYAWPCAEVFYTGLSKGAVRPKEEERDELPARCTAGSWHEWVYEEELKAARRAADMLRRVFVGVECDEGWRLLFHGLSRITISSSAAKRKERERLTMSPLQ